MAEKTAEEIEQEKKDLEETGGDDSGQSTDEPSAEGDDPLKKDGEEGGAESDPPKDGEGVDDMLADGTEPNKRVTIPKKKLDDLTEIAKIYEKFGPLLQKLQEKPEVVKELLGDGEEEGGSSVEKRIAILEADQKQKLRNALKDALTQAVKTWPDFRSHWEKVQPVMATLEKQGIPVHLAMQQAYFAVNPEAAAKEERMVAQEIQNADGKTNIGGGASKVVTQAEGELSAEDAEMAKFLNLDPKLYKKHAAHIAKFQGI